MKTIVCPKCQTDEYVKSGLTELGDKMGKIKKACINRYTIYQ